MSPSLLRMSGCTECPEIFAKKKASGLESTCRLLNVADGVEPNRLQFVVEIRITIEASIAHLSKLQGEFATRSRRGSLRRGLV